MRVADVSVATVAEGLGTIASDGELSEAETGGAVGWDAEVGSVRAVRLLAAIALAVGSIVGERLSTIATIGEVLAVGEIVRSEAGAIGDRLATIATEGGAISGVSESLSADSGGESLARGANSISELGAGVSTNIGLAVSLSANTSTELFARGADVGSVVSIEATASVELSSLEVAGLAVATLAVTDSDLVVIGFDISSLVLEVELLVDITLSLEIASLVLEVSSNIEVSLVLEVSSLVLGLTSELEVSGWGFDGAVITVGSLLTISLLFTISLLLVSTVGLLESGGGCGEDSSSDRRVHLICFFVIEKEFRF